MTDTMVTLTGNAATAVEHRYTKDGAAAARFRMACTPRRFDREQGRWADGPTSFYTVRAWRALADNLAASVAVGEPLVVRGRLTVREGEHPPERGGGKWFAAEIDAVAIGHDLTRGTAAFRRAARMTTLPGTSALPGTGALPDQGAMPGTCADANANANTDANVNANVNAATDADAATSLGGAPLAVDASPAAESGTAAAGVRCATTGGERGRTDGFTSGTARSEAGDGVPGPGMGASEAESDSPEKVSVS